MIKMIVKLDTTTNMQWSIVSIANSGRVLLVQNLCFQKRRQLIFSQKVWSSSYISSNWQIVPIWRKMFVVYTFLIFYLSAKTSSLAFPVYQLDELIRYFLKRVHMAVFCFAISKTFSGCLNIHVGCNTRHFFLVGCGNFLNNRICLASSSLACKNGYFYRVPRNSCLFGQRLALKVSSSLFSTSLGRSTIWRIVSVGILLMTIDISRHLLPFVVQRFVKPSRRIATIVSRRAENSVGGVTCSCGSW